MAEKQRRHWIRGNDLLRSGVRGESRDIDGSDSGGRIEVQELSSRIKFGIDVFEWWVNGPRSREF